MNKSLLPDFKGLFSNIGIVYFFILPVYMPVRALGVELHSYEKVISSSLDLVLYFTQITLLLACNSMVLSFFYEIISNRISINEKYTLHWYRSISLLFAIFFIITSYQILNPADLLHLYGWSGAHYFIICFFQLLIRSELNCVSKQTKKSLANNYFGIVLNISGVIALLIFSVLYSKQHIEYYNNYCIILGAIFCFYLTFGRKYYRSLLILMKKYSLSTLAKFYIWSFLLLIVASIFSVLFMMAGIFEPLIILAYLGISYKKLKKEVDQRDLGTIINIGMGYGFILAVLTGSIFVFILKDQRGSLNIFNFAYSFEPAISVIIGLVFTWYIVKESPWASTGIMDNRVFRLNFSVPVILGIFMLICYQKMSLLASLIFLFGCYALLEYLSLFFVRQIALKDEYKEIQGARLTNFNSIVINGLSPSLIYLLVFFMRDFTNYPPKELMAIILATLTVLSFALNLGQRVWVNNERR